MTSIFWLAMFGSSTHRRRKRTTYLESWGNSESETCVLCARYWFGNLTSFDLTLSWPPSKVIFDDVMGLDDHHYRCLRAKLPRKHVSHCIFVTFFLMNFCDMTLTLTFSNMAFVLTRYASQTFASTLSKDATCSKMQPIWSKDATCLEIR